MTGKARVVGAIVLTFTAAAALSSCNIITPAAFILMGPPKKDAIFLLTDRPTVVFVDDARSRVGRTDLRRIIGDRIAVDLMVEKVVTETIASRDALAVARSEAYDNRIAIDSLGEIVGAEQVIYIDMVIFDLSPDGFAPAPVAAGLIKVIDVTAKERLFPDADSSDSSYAVQVQLPQISPELYRTPSTRNQLNEALAEAFGLEVARLFYKHVPDELGSRLNN